MGRLLLSDRKARLRFALRCLQLARKEMKQYGRQFMDPGMDLYDSAVQYGGSASPKLTKAEIVTVAKMNKERRKALGK